MDKAIEIHPFPILIDSDALAAIDAEVRKRARADWEAELEGAEAAAIDQQVQAEIGAGVAIRWPDGLPEEIVRGLYLAARLLSPIYAPEAYLQHQAAIEAWLVAQGRAIDEAGGIEAMRLAHYLLKPLVGSQVVHLSHAWDGIGSWRH